MNVTQNDQVKWQQAKHIIESRGALGKYITQLAGIDTEWDRDSMRPVILMKFYR